MISAISSVSDAFYKSKPRFTRPASLQKKHIFRDTLAILSKQENVHFRFLVALDIFISVLDIFSLALLICIVQFYMQPVESNRFSFLPEWMLNKNSIVPIGIFFILFSLKNVLAFLITKRQNNFIAGVAVRISKNNLIRYQNTEMEEFVNVDSSVHIRKIAHQPFDFCQHMLTGAQQIITQGSLIIISILAIIFFNAKLFLLLLLILLPPVVGVFYFIKGRLTKTKQLLKTSNQFSLQYLMDALKGFVEANVYERNDFFLKRFISHRKKFSKHLFDSISIQTMPSRLVEIFAIMGLFILITIAKWTGNNDTGTLITIGAFLAAAYKIIPGMVKIVNTLSQMKAYEFSLNDIAKDVNDTHSKVSENIRTIEFSNVKFRYSDTLVLNDFSFSMQAGDFVGVSGKSGSGKTTLFNLMLGFLSPCSGEILINDQPFHKKDIRKRWPSIAYVRQQCFFIHDTVARNITLQEENFDQAKLEYAVITSGLDELIGNSPDGVNRIITENGKNISGGQQQRISLARALYKDASLILLDEPFNELDEASEFSLLNYFRGLTFSGKIVVMITHNKKALSFCNKIISLDHNY